MLNSIIFYAVLLIMVILLSFFAIAYTSILNFKLTISFFSEFIYFSTPFGRETMKEVMSEVLSKNVRKGIASIASSKDSDLMKIYNFSDKSEAAELKRQAKIVLESQRSDSLISKQEAKAFMKDNNLWGVYGFFYSYLQIFSDVKYQHEQLGDTVKRNVNKRQVLVSKALIRQSANTGYQNLLSEYPVGKNIFNINKKLRVFSVPN